MPAGSSSTSVFNIALNTVNAGGFIGTLQKAQGAVNSVVVSLNKASQAAATGRVNAQLQQVALDKVNATYARASASLDVFRVKMQQNAQALGAAQQRQGYLNNVVNQLTQTLKYQTDQYNKLSHNTNANAGILAAWHNQISQTTQRLSETQKELNVVNKTVTAATSKEALYQAQLKAREARLAAQKQSMEELKKPLTWWESLIATGIQLFNVTNKITAGFDKITLTVQRAMRIADKLRYVLSGGKAETFIGGKPETGIALTTGAAGVDTGPAVSAQQRLGNAVAVVAQKFGILRQAISFALGQALYQGVYNLRNALQTLGQGAVMTAGRFQELSLVAALLASRTGMTQDKVDSLITSIRAYGIEGSVAANLVAQFVRYNLDLSKALQLARVAQDVAVVSGENSSDTLDRLIYGTVTYNTEVLRTAGLTLNIASAEKDFAATLHKSSEQLTENERAQAVLNGILEEGVKLTGAYETAMTMASKQLRSLPRLLDDLSVALGEPFQGAFFNIVMGINKFVESLTKTFSKGGKLEPMVKGLGQVAGLITKPFEQMAQDALVWGENVITSFAEGMLRGMVAVMDSLIRIANLVTYWLSPGSPPKILPNLTRWGTEAMTEYFRGFTLADFSMFKEIGGTVESMLRSVLVNVGTGEGAEAAKGGIKQTMLDRILGSREALSQALTEMKNVGSVSEAAFRKIFESMGGASLEMQNYIRSSFALEAQNRKVTEAQKALDEATKTYNDLLKPVEEKLQSITDAQTDLADAQKKTLLELILKDPNATLAEKDQARLEIQRLDAEKAKRLVIAEQAGKVEAAQTALDAEVTKQTAMQETVNQQKAVLEQQMEQNKLLQEYIDLLDQLAAAQEKADKETGGGGATKEPPKPITGGGGAFAPKKVLEDLQTWILGLIGKFEQLKTAAGEAWTAILTTMQPAIRAFEGFMGAVGRLQQALSKTRGDIETLIAKIIAFTTQDLNLTGTSIFGNLEGAVDEFTKFWNEHHQEILDTVFRVWQFILVTVSVFGIALAGIMHGIMQGINGDWAGAWATTQKTANDALDVILQIPGVKREKFLADWGGIFYNVGDIVFTVGVLGVGRIMFGFIQTLVGLVEIGAGLITLNWGLLWKGITNLLEGFKNIFTPLWDGFWILMNLLFNIKLGELKENWRLFWVAVYDKFIEIKNSLWSGFKTWLGNTLTFLILKALEIETEWGNLLNGLLSAQVLKIVDLLAGWNKWILDAKQAVIDAVTPYYDAGAALIQGLIDGAKSKAQAMIDAVVGVVKGALAEAKKLLGIAGDPQPSTLMAAWIGEPMMAGLAKGILANSHQLQKALTMAIGDSVSVSMLASGGSVPGSSSSYSQVTNFNYSPTYGGAPRSVLDNFALMKAML